MLNMSIYGYQYIRLVPDPLAITYPHFEQKEYNIFLAVSPDPVCAAAMQARAQSCTVQIASMTNFCLGRAHEAPI